jgi:hypothetical protein
MRSLLKNRSGVAMMMALLVVVNLIILESAFVMRTIQGARMASLERDRLKTFYAAQGGAEVALKEVDTLINGYLQDTILAASPSGVAADAKAKVNAGDGIGWLVYAVRNNNTAVLAQDGEEALYSSSGTVGGMTYQYTITFVEKSDPVSVTTDKWDFLYAYRIDSTSTTGTLTSEVSVSGDFTVRVQKDNFAKFSLYTNNQQYNGDRVWFTSRAAFYGPVHTNDRFNFAFANAGIFGDLVTQSQTTARFFNNNNPVLINGNANGNIDTPVFLDAFNRGVAPITLASATAESAMVTEAKKNNNYQNNGIYIPATNQDVLTGGVYVKGNSTIAMSVDANDHAVYTIVQGGNTRRITVDEDAGTTTVLNPADNSSVVYSGKPVGASAAGSLIYVEGSITALSGTVQRDTQLTIASHDDITITNNVLYSDYTPAVGTPGNASYVPPSAEGKENLLGLVSWNGNVHIASSAPDDVNIHATIMAENGVFTVDNYNNGDIKGVATLLGGVITDDYGAFGQFNSSTGQTSSGYGRNFVYDQRMQQGYAPPYFPSLATFIAFTNDITDKLVWQGKR